MSQYQAGQKVRVTMTNGVRIEGPLVNLHHEWIDQAEDILGGDDGGIQNLGIRARTPDVFARIVTEGQIEAGIIGIEVLEQPARPEPVRMGIVVKEPDSPVTYTRFTVTPDEEFCWISSLGVVVTWSELDSPQLVFRGEAVPSVS